MFCLRPIEVRVKNSKGKDNGLRRVVPCGKCPNCLKNYQHQWIVRLKEQQKHSEASYFVTLTYEDDSKGFQKFEVQKFLNRLQHRCKYVGATLKYFVISEYGRKTGRAHHHALLFLDKYIDNFSDLILKTWKLGFIYVGTCNERSISYTTKYVLKDWPNDLDWSDYPDSLNPAKCRFISKGIGLDFLSDDMRKYYKDLKAMHYVDNGVMSQMPRYYVDKVFTKSEQKEMKITNRCYVERMQILREARDGRRPCRRSDGSFIRDIRTNRILFESDDDGRWYRAREAKLKWTVELWKKRKQSNIF